MRLDIPDEIPRRRATGDRISKQPLEPSPIERYREALAAIAADRHTVPHAQHNRLHQPAPPKDERHATSPDRPMDQRPRRQSIPPQAIGLSLREEERKVLSEVGRFRVVATRDLAETIYGGRRSRMERDLAFLKEKGMVSVDTVNARRDGRGGRVERIEVVTLTRAGQSLARLTGDLPHDQKLYAGLVKPREVEHDAQIYRAWQKEVARIELRGGTNLLVKLDFELKSEVQKSIYAARRADPERGMGEIKQKVAQRFELPYVNDGIQIPDARIEYDLAQGGSGHEDIEVLTAAYRPGHLRAKAQAGFRVYASASDRATLTAKVEDDHYLMENILEL